MAENTEESLLQDDSLPDKNSDDSTRLSSDRDLHNTFSLFKLYMDGKMNILESMLAQSIRVVLDLLDKVKDRNESNDIASDREDEKKIGKAESRAMRTMKDKTKGRPAPYSNKHRLPPAETYANPTYNQQFKRHSFHNSVARR
ncbi:Hypothetical predicted protein [Mytilus galloprovincialis]|uniref:Uncharacterized protein n=1 Tax=Mytilus galloprovincialis TaxID=29158 RepID=A0A8B6FAA8_MYTGA|nr:Hypothetical predicted protein [Mytilus galloprovincialis]